MPDFHAEQHGVDCGVSAVMELCSERSWGWVAHQPLGKEPARGGGRVPRAPTIPGGSVVWVKQPLNQITPEMAHPLIFSHDDCSIK